jgi:hypothetical protein
VRGGRRSSDRDPDAPRDAVRLQRRGRAGTRDDLCSFDDLPAGRRRQTMGADLPIDSSDRNSDRSGSGVQNASDGACGALVEGLNPKTSQRDADRGRTGDENGKAKRAHGERVAAGPDGLGPRPG